VASREDKQMVVVDGSEGREYNRIESGPIFSPDSKDVTYTAKRDNKGFIVKNEIEVADFNSSRISLLSPDGKKVAYICEKAGKKSVIFDGKQGKEYTKVTKLTFSPNGKRLAYSAWYDDGMCAVIDGQEQQQYKWVMNITFSPDSKRVAYSAGAAEEYNEQFVIVDGIEGKRYKSQDPYVICEFSPPFFSPDSKHIAYVVEMKDKSWVVLDEVEGRHYDEIRKKTIGGWDNWDKSLAFSPDGKIAYWAKRSNMWRIVVKGVESEDYWEYLENSNLVFESPNFLHGIAFRDWEIMRVEIQISEN